MTDACKGGGDYPLLLSCKRCVLKQFQKITSQSVHRIFTVTGTHWENTKNDVKDFVKAAMDRCIEEGILMDFFKERYNEVIKVVELDYTFDRRLELTRDESWHDGWNDLIIKMLQNGKSAQEIADFCGVPIEQICDVEQRIMQRP